ncbi:patatin-domain-containing protein [Schizopora paradoxa]|uniref:Patatin-like phospholipase domain-containing protein n=1 Tax=Schizopora paradoxa TaxID=27342 RepID=A0A0H2RUI9_9AGAM|nr:patatin-domain-containing protein [Schizopora paradoxa]
MPVVDDQEKKRELAPDSLEELNADYVNERHIESFAHALTADFFVDNDYLDSPRHSPRSMSLSSVNNLATHGSRMSMHSIGRGPPRIRKVSALSDFAPVNVRVKKRRKGAELHDKRQEWLFLLLRWPLLLFIFVFIFFEFAMYVFVRQCVNAKEYITAWRGKKGTLRKRLQEAKTYQEWKAAAKALDHYLEFDDWKGVDEDPYYDWKLVRKVNKSLRTLRRNGDVRGVLGVLETCIRTNFAGIESARLYSDTFYGSKDLIELYLSEVERSLAFIRDSPILSNEEKRRFFKSANTNLGISALCLSGGASFGYYHFGVLKAFVDANMLPRVVTGTSAGGLVAALACTRTDAELKKLLVPELADRLTACSDPLKIWAKRFWQTGARFDSVEWARKSSFFTRGSLTFKEAYMRTGRILNISVIPADRHSPTKLLNYITAPDTVIWSAILASAAVPGILNPVVLMQKTHDGNIIPWNWGSKFKDGSLRVDIPIQSLNHYFNVTHPVVSQVNPHVHLFFFAPRGSAGKPVAHRKGKGWRGNFLLSAAEQWLKLELTKNFKVIRDLDLLPQILGQDWSSVFLQRFDGAVTLWPKSRIRDWFNILSDPTREELDRMMKVGERVTWPKLHMVENRYRIEREIFRGRKAVRKGNSKNAPLPVRDKIPESSERDAVSPLEEKGAAEMYEDSIQTPNAESAAVDGDGRIGSWPGDNDDDDDDVPFKYSRKDGKLRIKVDPPEDKSIESPQRSPNRTRIWASQLGGSVEPAEPGCSNAQKKDQGHLSSDSTPPKSPRQGLIHLPHAGGLIKRIRQQSLVNFTNPFPGAMRRMSRMSLAEAAQEEEWSSDSSELDEELDMNEEGSFYEPLSIDHEPDSGREKDAQR